MDGNNWRPAAAQPQPPAEQQQPSSLDAGDWRSQLPTDSRQRIVNKIMDTLKRHLPFSGQEGLHELKKIAVRFEEKIYSAATSQTDYLRKISLKMLTMETKSQNTTVPGNMPGTSKSPPDPASQSMQPQAPNQGQPLSVPLANNQSQTRQQLLSQNFQNIAPSGVQGSTGLPSALPPAGSLSQAPLAQVGQNPNMQNVAQNPMGSTMGQGVANMFANSQRQIHGRQVPQQVVPQQQQQQQSQNPQQQFLYQQQLQFKQKFPQGNVSHSHVQSHMQQQQQQQQQQPQQQQQSLLPPNQLPSSQQPVMQTSSVMQPSMIQSTPVSGLQQNQQSSVQQSTQSILQQHQQQVRQQQQPPLASTIHQQQTAPAQQQILPSQPQLMGQQQLVAQQQNGTNLQHNSLLGQQSGVSEVQPQLQLQQLQQHQKLLGQQNNVQNLQQQQQQHLLSQQNNLASVHQQQLGPQTNASGLLQQQQQQQLLVSQSGNLMQSNQHSAHMLQQSKISVPQQNQQSASTLLPSQGQPSQAQLQQQLSMQQQPTLLQRDMQQRIQSSSLLQTQNVIDQQKQIFQPQRAVPEASSTSLDSTAQTGNANGGDWQEEVYQKIKTMKELYLLELSEMYQKIAAKLQQQDALPQDPKIPQLERFKMFKSMLEHVISFLQVPKSNVTLVHKDKLANYEKQIKHFLATNSNRPRKPGPSMQPGQLPPHHVQPMQQVQQAQTQVTQVQPHENQMNPQLQPMNVQGSVPQVQQSNVSSLQHGVTSGSGVSNGHPSMMNSLQAGQTMDSGQGNVLGSLQQVAVGCLQQNPVSAPQQSNMNALASQNGGNALQANGNSLQSNPNMLQNQHLKQHQEPQMMQTQQLKHQFQRQMQQQLMQKQQLLQQQHQQQQQQQQQQLQTSLSQQAKQQQHQLQAHQMSQLHQMNDANDLKVRQGLVTKPGLFQQHPSANQRLAYHNQPLKPGAAYPVSSPQLLQAVSPQIPQHSSPQIDQQSLLPSITKNGTPLQSANSPFVVPSPSTPMAPSPMPGDSEKHTSTVSSLSNSVSAGNQQLNGAVGPAQSLAIGTPGISASPLLAEFTSPDQGNALTTVSGKSSVTEHPLERLIRAVKSMPPKALNASVSDIGSVVSMVDRIAGSAPGNGSRAAVGEDLVAMTKCRLQARNIVTQDGTNGTKKMRRFTSAMPLNITSSAGSVNDSFKQFTGLTGSETSDSESTATSNIKRPRIEANHALFEEIREINQRLIDTVVDISDEDVIPNISAAAAAEGGEGTIIKCSFNAVALSPNLKSQYASAQASPIQPLRLLVPSNYPNCSPVLLDKFPVEVSKDFDDLSVKAKSKFSISLRSLSQPMSLKDIARTWDICARAVISDYAQQSGGGSFSSRYGSWENCLSAA